MAQKVNEQRLQELVNRLRTDAQAAADTAAAVAQSYPAGAADAQTLADEAQASLQAAQDALDTLRNPPAPVDDDTQGAVAGGVWERDPRDVLRWAAGRAGALEDRVAQMPTPGGIGPLLITLIVLVWAIVAVNNQGMTRLQLLWYTVTGRTRLSTERQPGQADDYGESGGSSSGWDDTDTSVTAASSGETFNPISSPWVDWNVQQ